MTPDILNLWLVTYYEEAFVPESAYWIINALAGVDNETCAVSIKFFAMEAERELTGN